METQPRPKSGGRGGGMKNLSAVHLVQREFHVTIKYGDREFITAIVHDHRCLSSLFHDYLLSSGAHEMNIVVKTKPVSMKTFLNKVNAKKL
jgi:hypothetical protein